MQVSGYIGNGAVKECGLVVCAGLRELVLHGFEREHGKLVEVAPGQHAVGQLLLLADEATRYFFEHGMTLRRRGHRSGLFTAAGTTRYMHSRTASIPFLLR